jgi:poly-gamma-glutamate synthesis protein (capsule biosynthesis protein)
MLFGDVNLGRNLGKEILKGNIEYPLKNVRNVLRRADAVFVNLESPLTDQNGETESPYTNYVFCGPPAGARVLKRGGVTIVSTANNHAYDYALKGLSETIRSLDSAGIRHVGTSVDSVRFFPPAVVQRHGIKVGFLAYTEFVNGKEEWQGRISVYDSIRARKEIAKLRRAADVVIVSFHGGSEYSEAPRPLTLRRMRSLIRAGADIVVGHHPHVPQGVEEMGGKLIFYSLGNFVFNQSDTWAKRSFGVELKLLKQGRHISLESVALIPIRAYKQPSTGLPETEFREMVERLKKTSNVGIAGIEDSLIVPSLHLTGFR